MIVNMVGGGGEGISIVQVPNVTIGTYTYNGSAQGPTIAEYDSTKIVVTNATKINAGTYTMTLALKNTSKMVWNDLTTADKTYEYTINKANITGATVSISGYTYAGTKSTPTISGNTSGGSVTYYGRSTATGSATLWDSVTSTTYDAGTRYCYAVIAETANYNSCTTANTSFTIAKATLTGATVSLSGYTYGGTKATPAISGNTGGGAVTYYGRATATGTATAWSNVTSTTYDAGTRYIYATIAESTNYLASTTANTAFTIAKASFTASVSISGYTYAGTKSTPTVSNNPGNGSVTFYGRSTASGSATAWDSVTSTTYDAGTRYCYAVIGETTNYASYTTQNASFTIAKADQVITLSKSSVTLNTSQMSDTVTVTLTKGNGALTASSGDSSIATASLSNGTITISAIANGSTSVTVKAASTTNYNEKTETISVAVSLVDTVLDNNDWATISAISAAGTASQYWNIGDRKKIRLNGTVGTLSLSNVDLYIFIIGFNHRSNIEGSGITFQGFKTALTGGSDVCLVDDAYGTNAGNTGAKKFQLNHWGGSSSPYNTNYGGWKGCDARYDILGSTNKQPSGYGSTPTTSRVGYDAESTTATSPVANTLMAALPSDLRAVMKPITKYTDNKGNSSNVSSNVTTSVDYLPLLSEYEVQGTRSYANQYEQNSQAQYEYYANGNSKVKYRHSAVSSPASWWCRSAHYTSATSFCGVSTDGSAYYFYSRSSYGLAPALLV